MSPSRLLLATAALALFAALPAAAFDLQGHRGARGLAPENTLPAFERALAVGVTTLELDVGLTKDGVVVVAHDSALNPALTRDASGRWLARRGPRLKDLRLKQLQAYDVGRLDPASAYAKGFPGQQPFDGTRIPTLAQVFARVRELGAFHVRFNIETKISPESDDLVAAERLTDALLQEVHAAGLGKRVTIQSFDWRSLRRVQQVDPSIRTSYLTVQTANSNNTRDGTWTGGLRLGDDGSVPRMVRSAGGRIWSPNAGVLTLALVEEAHSLGLKVLPWTVNDPAQMEQLLAWGVDGIITDHPERLRAVLQAHGVALPPTVP